MYKRPTNIGEKNVSGIVGFLTRHGIIKNSKTAIIIVILFCLAIMVLSIFVVYKVSTSGRAVPYSEIPASSKAKLPLPVQVLYLNQK